MPSILHKSISSKYCGKRNQAVGCGSACAVLWKCATSSFPGSTASAALKNGGMNFIAANFM